MSVIALGLNFQLHFKTKAGILRKVVKAFLEMFSDMIPFYFVSLGYVTNHLSLEVLCLQQVTYYTEAVRNKNSSYDKDPAYYRKFSTIS